MFSLPQGNNVGVMDRSDDEHPLVLQEVQSTDFENVLMALVKSCVINGNGHHQIVERLQSSVRMRGFLS